MAHFFRRGLCLALSLVILASSSSAFAAVSAPAERLGVVLLHDKNATPGRGGVAEAERCLRNAGFLVAAPELPWSRKRAFDAAFPQALVEISLVLEGLRLGGAAHVVLVGHGLGANAALAFAAYHGGEDAIVCLAPSHDPERYREVFLPDVLKARRMIAHGGASRHSRFMDVFHEGNYDLDTTAEIYLSYDDPDGEAVMPRSAAAIEKPIPILWIVGRKDPLSYLGRSYAFAKAPEHPRSRYEEVDADHDRVPGAAARIVVRWLTGLFD